VDDNCFLYVFVSDGRPGGANLEVALWAAPPDSPDDALDNLNIGYRIRIGGAYEVDDTFFHNCEKRILTLLPHLGGLRAAVQEELANPAFTSPRLTVYRLERRALACLQRAAGMKPGSAPAVALQTARAVALARRPLKHLEDACIAAAEALVAENALDPDLLAFFRESSSVVGMSPFLGRSLADHLYVLALGEISSAGARPLFT
jgi:hypothetical protein